jgi:hypothetical protein
MKRLHLFSFAFITLAFIPQLLIAQSKPIALNKENTHYFSYHNKPTILITSGEHYGAVLNLDFDYIPYLEELHSKGLNLTRTFTGAYVEPPGSFNIASNSLAPAPGRFICPWARSMEPGYANGGNKFDLNRWDVKYFNRLRNFAAAAQKRGIIIELSLFCPFYDEKQWSISPMNAINNITGVGNTDRNNVYTLDKNDGLLAIQENLVIKIVNELKNFDNVIYEICNEPYFGGVTMEWQHRIADVISESEKAFKFRHLISQNIANGTAKIKDPHPAVSVFNFHYASPPVAVAENYNLGKVIGDNETGFRGTTDSTYRREGWEFILAGGSLYNNLDYSFTANEESGTFVYPSTQPGGGSKTLRNQLSFLKNFIYRFDFIKMKPDNQWIFKIFPENSRIHTLAETGKQYAAYLFGGLQNRLELMLPAGTYKVEWLNPISGKTITKQFLKHTGNNLTIISPGYTEDIALIIRKIVYY